LQNAFGGDAGRIGLNRCLAVRRLAAIVWGFLEFVERNENLGAALRNDFNGLGRHDESPFWVQAQLARLRPCPSARPGVSKRRVDRAEGDRPPLKGRSKSWSAQARGEPRRFEI